MISLKAEGLRAPPQGDSRIACGGEPEEPLAAPITIRTSLGLEVVDLDEFEARVQRGEIDPSTQVHFPPVTGVGWARAGELELFRRLYEPRALYFQRAFHLGRIPVLTFLLSLANVAVFVLELRRHGGIEEAIVALGAKAGPLIMDLGELWRFFTANFVHQSWFHLLFNLFVLFHFGAALENAYRQLDYLCIFVASALGSTLLSFAMTDAISAGASGAAYGMLGGAVVFGLQYRRILPARYRRVLGGAVIPTVLVFLFIGWTSIGVDNWAHVGGLVAGGTATFLFQPRLLGEPMSRGRALLTRVLPLAAIALLLTAGGEVLQGHLPLMRTVHDDRLGLTLGVPSLWHEGADELGPLSYHNGISGSVARASVSADAHLVEGPLDLEGEARSFAEEELLAQQEAHRIRRVHVDPLRYAHVGGLLGVVLEASFEREGTGTHLTAHFFGRGQQLVQLTFLRPEGLPEYQRVFERIVDSVQPVEPRFLREARASVLLLPASADALIHLASAEREVGHAKVARQALRRAALLAPGRAEPWALTAELSFSEGLPSEGCSLAGRARLMDPRGFYTLVAGAECALARGDPVTGAARLREALQVRSDDAVRARLERIEAELRRE